MKIEKKPKVSLCGRSGNRWDLVCNKKYLIHADFFFLI